jgi:hypothetical protein
VQIRNAFVTVRAVGLELMRLDHARIGRALVGDLDLLSGRATSVQAGQERKHA